MIQDLAPYSQIIRESDATAVHKMVLAHVSRVKQFRDLPALLMAAMELDLTQKEEALKRHRKEVDAKAARIKKHMRSKRAAGESPPIDLYGRTGESAYFSAFVDRYGFPKKSIFTAGEWLKKAKERAKKAGRRAIRSVSPRSMRLRRAGSPAGSLRRASDRLSKAASRAASRAASKASSAARRISSRRRKSSPRPPSDKGGGAERDGQAVDDAPAQAGQRRRNAPVRPWLRRSPSSPSSPGSKRRSKRGSGGRTDDDNAGDEPFSRPAA